MLLLGSDAFQATGAGQNLTDAMDKSGFVVPQGAGPPLLPAVLSPAAWPAPAALRQQQSMTLYPHEDVVFAKM